MSTQLEYNTVKEELLQAYAAYTDIIKSTPFEDLRLTPVRKLLVHGHTKAMLAGINYRSFVIKHQMPNEFQVKRD